MCCKTKLHSFRPKLWDGLSSVKAKGEAGQVPQQLPQQPKTLAKHNGDRSSIPDYKLVEIHPHLLSLLGSKARVALCQALSSVCLKTMHFENDLSHA